METNELQLAIAEDVCTSRDKKLIHTTKRTFMTCIRISCSCAKCLCGTNIQSCGFVEQLLDHIREPACPNLFHVGCILRISAEEIFFHQTLDWNEPIDTEPDQESVGGVKARKRKAMFVSKPPV